MAKKDFSVLIVTPIKTNIKNIQEALQHYGIFNTDSAENPFDAEKMILENKYDFALIHAELKGGPFGNSYGFDIADLAKKKKPEIHVIGICYSDSCELDCAKRWKEKGYDFLLTPVKYEDIELIMSNLSL
ncbi:MAG TPA: hypothetical protein VJB11_02505 [archaeon]|nr:hypothetical protein [archaeon]